MSVLRDGVGIVGKRSRQQVQMPDAGLSLQQQPCTGIGRQRAALRHAVEQRHRAVMPGLRVRWASIENAPMLGVYAAVVAVLATEGR
jgi:hypothetical protein